ncbi:MAG: hypothetical protein AAGC57_02565 [Pseudomonadota bacterium]
MTNSAIWTITEPGYRAHLRRGSEARAAAVYQALGPVRRAIRWGVDGVHALGVAIRVRLDAMRSAYALEHLDARHLEDIGLTRHDVDDLAAGKWPAAARMLKERGEAPKPEERPKRRPIALTFRDTLDLEEAPRIWRRAA